MMFIRMLLAAVIFSSPLSALSADVPMQNGPNFDDATVESMKLAKTLLTLLGEVKMEGRNTATLSIDSYRIRGGDRSIAELRFGDKIIVIDLHENVLGENHVFVYSAPSKDSYFPPVKSSNPAVGKDVRPTVPSPSPLR